MRPSRGARVLALMLAVLAAPALAVQPDEILPDKNLEVRARHISSELRCLVCQNQSIDDSDAPLARDLRVLVRERLQAGQSDDQVRTFLVGRYGDFVLLKPPVTGRTALLWGAPACILLAAGMGLVFTWRQRRSGPRDVAALSEAEESRIRSLQEGAGPG